MLKRVFTFKHRYFRQYKKYDKTFVYYRVSGKFNAQQAQPTLLTRTVSQKLTTPRKMSDKEKQLNIYLSRAKEAEDLLKSKGFLYADSSFIWQTLQIEFNCTDIPTEILFKDLSVVQIVEVVLKHKALYGQPICKIILEESILPDEIDNSLIKAYLKFKGEKWVVHKNDLDNFPSNPHAHNYDTNTKLHLGSGELFREKNICGYIKPKDLKSLRQLIQKRLPKLKLPKLKLN